MKKIRVLVVDDHALIRHALHSLLSSDPGIELAGEAENGAQAIELTRSLCPDVILMDLVMPKVDGIEAIRQIKKDYPDAKILVLTSFAEDDKVFPAIKAGALGYLLKDTAPKQLLQSVYDVYHGEPSLHPSIALKLIHELNQPSNLPPAQDPLTEREVEVLKLLAQGLTNPEIAEKLSISGLTVRTHIRNILNKLHLANRTQAALYAIRKGLAPLKNSGEG